jgi:hypothetical protein
MTVRLHHLIAIGLIALPVGTTAQTLAVGQAEASRCHDQIAAVRRDVFNKYSDTLTELQLQFQRSADLEGALAVRAELQRVQKDQAITQKDLVPEPRALRSAQQQAMTKIEELTTALVNETLPRLIEVKRKLTIDGKLDDALAIRGLIEKLQTDYLRIERPDPALAVQADTVLQAYAADRTRADKIYKGARMTVRGAVGAFRQDPNDSKNYVVYLKGTGNNGWVACFINGGNLRFREEKQVSPNQLVITQRDGSVIARLSLTQTIDIQGMCEGFEDVVRLVNCEVISK